jgi:GNAT superfamily N-acetyltransferase
VLLALLPDWEAKSIGKRLLHGVINLLQRNEFKRLFLGCSSDPGSRSCGFYRPLGWRSTGDLGVAQDEFLDHLPGDTPQAHPRDIH